MNADKDVAISFDQALILLDAALTSLGANEPMLDTVRELWGQIQVGIEALQSELEETHALCDLHEGVLEELGATIKDHLSPPPKVVQSSTPELVKKVG